MISTDGIDAALAPEEWRRLGIAVLAGAAGVVGSTAAHWLIEKIRGGEPADPEEVEAETTSDEVETVRDETQALRSRVAGLEAEMTLRVRIAELEVELALRRRVAALEAELADLREGEL